MRLVIFGPQGAGKGTQSARIAEKYGIPTISTGDIFRWAIKGRTALGLEIEQFVNSGRLVPDILTIRVVRERLDAPDAKDGFLLDGFPRNVAQAEALDEMLAEKNVALDAALILEVPEEISLQRIIGRRACSKCGRNYNLDAPPENDWTCDTCGGEVVFRVDDEDSAAIKSRLATYHEQTEPLKAYYSERGLLREVDGTAPPDDVFARITATL